MEENSTPSAGQDLIKHAAKFGAIMGGIMIAVTALCYVADYTLLVDWKLGIVFIVFFIGFTIYAGINFRNSGDGFLAYGKAFQHSYVTLVVSGLVGTVFSLLLYYVIDPDLPAALTDAAVEKTGEMLKGFGTPEDKIDETLEQVRIDTPKRFTALGLVKQFGIGLIIDAVLAAITALIVRRNRPETF